MFTFAYVQVHTNIYRNSEMPYLIFNGSYFSVKRFDSGILYQFRILKSNQNIKKQWNSL